MNTTNTLATFDAEVTDTYGGETNPANNAKDIAAVILYGDESAPCQIWGTTASESPTIFHEFERLA